MPRFRVDAPKARVIRTFQALGFQVRREGVVGKSETLTLPNHLRIKGHTLQNACRQAGIPKTGVLEGLRANLNTSLAEHHGYFVNQISKPMSSSRMSTLRKAVCASMC